MKLLYINTARIIRWDILLSLLLLTMIFITITVDYLQAYLKGSSFYLSESLLFCSFWILFLPLLKIQWKLTNTNKGNWVNLTIALSAATIHLFSFPVLVYVLSSLLFYHTFAYHQTFGFALIEHMITLIIVYFLPLILYLIHEHHTASTQNTAVAEKLSFDQATTFTVTDSQGSKLIINVSDIRYISANYPYVNIHHSAKKYLHQATLKDMAELMEPCGFVRIHKSTVVNMNHAVSYKSRLNGDYDLSLTDGSVLRVSRVYALAFKGKFTGHPRLTTD